MNSALAPLGMEPVGEGPGPFAKMIAQEVNSITKVVESVASSQNEDDHIVLSRGSPTDGFLNEPA